MLCGSCRGLNAVPDGLDIDTGKTRVLDAVVSVFRGDKELHNARVFAR